MRRLGLLALLWGCAQPAALPECRLHSDCLAPLRCVAERCVPECREDVDCEAGEVCAGGACQPRIEPARVCALVRDCRTGETCRGGICAKVELVPPAPPADAGIREDAGLGAPDAGPGDAAAPMGLPYGAVCASASACASTLCLGPTGAAQGRCTRTCAQNADCVYPDACIDVPGAGRLCATAPSVGGTGAPCPNGPSDCAGGLCLRLGSPDPICTHECSPLPACPQGMSCQPVPDGSGGAVPVCVPAGSGLGFGAACAQASACATGLCIGVAGSGQGLCTAPCHQVPCPRGWTCAATPDGTGATVQVCAPQGAVGGGYGAACTGASSCTNGLCLHDVRTNQAFCTIPCSRHGDCAAVPGLLCVQLASGSAVCGPP